MEDNNNNAIVVQRDATTCAPLVGEPKSLISKGGKNTVVYNQELPPELGNGKTCQGLLRRFVHKITNNNEISPHNDMNNKTVTNLLPYFPISLSLKKKIAFTLAETLITLGIIGIVAAMTIPTLISNYQKKQTVTKLQKAISILNQAYKLSFDDVGEPSAQEAFNMGSEQYFQTYWAPYIKTALICTGNRQCGYKKEQPWVFTNNRNYALAVVAPGNRATFYTADGFLYVIFTAVGGTGAEQKDNRVLVDINGAEGPNKLGRDVFFLTRVEKDGAGIQALGMDESDQSINRECSTAGQGLYCAERIRRAGWEIDKSYPWK